MPIAVDIFISGRNRRNFTSDTQASLGKFVCSSTIARGSLIDSMFLLFHLVPPLRFYPICDSSSDTQWETKWWLLLGPLFTYQLSSKILCWKTSVLTNAFLMFWSLSCSAPLHSSRMVCHSTSNKSMHLCAVLYRERTVTSSGAVECGSKTAALINNKKY